MERVQLVRRPPIRADLQVRVSPSAKKVLAAAAQERGMPLTELLERLLELSAMGGLQGTSLVDSILDDDADDPPAPVRPPVKLGPRAQACARTAREARLRLKALSEA
jgi:hypothetical protein